MWTYANDLRTSIASPNTTLWHRTSDTGSPGRIHSNHVQLPSYTCHRAPAIPNRKRCIVNLWKKCLPLSKTNNNNNIPRALPERWLSEQRHVLLSLKTWVWFSGHTWMKEPTVASHPLTPYMLLLSAESKGVPFTVGIDDCRPTAGKEGHRRLLYSPT